MKRGSFQIAGEPHPTQRYHDQPMVSRGVRKWVIGCAVVTLVVVVVLIVKALGG